MNPADNNSNINPSTGDSGGFGSTPSAGGPSGFSVGDTMGGIGGSQATSAKPGTDSPDAASSNDAMTMDSAQEAPFVPAAPAPGSIGSVTSGPAVPNLAAAVAPTGADGSAAFAPVNDMNSTITPAGDNNLVAQAASETPTMNTAFNPFAPTPAASTPAVGGASTTAANVALPNTAMDPMSMGAQNAANPQPAQGAQPTMPSPFEAHMNNLAAKGPKPMGKNSNLLTIILGGVGVIAIIAAVTFCILWRQALANPEIRYVPTPSVGEQGASTMTCTRMYGGNEIGGMDNLVNAEASLKLNFQNDELQSSNLYTIYNFVDPAAAEAANAGIFAAMVSSMALNSDGGEVIVSTSSQPLESRVEYREDTDITLMSNEQANGRNLPQAEDGSLQKNRGDVEAYYTTHGWTCK